MKTIFETPQFIAFLDTERDIVIICRNEVPYESFEQIKQIFATITEAVKPYAEKPMLSDLRRARGNNLPAWENTVKPLVGRLYATFKNRAILVQTAAGKLQTQRLARERGDMSNNIFTDEAEAIAYLLRNKAKTA